MVYSRYKNGFHQNEWMKNEEEWFLLAAIDQKEENYFPLDKEMVFISRNR